MIINQANGGRSFKMQIRLLQFIKYFCVTLFILYSNTLLAEESSFLVDRRSFKSKPDRACVNIFTNDKLEYSTCSSIGFTTSSLTQINNESFVDYLYFFKVDATKIDLNNSKLSLIMTSYIKDNKILAIAPFKNITQNDLVFFVSSKSLKLASQIDTLLNEKNELTSEVNINSVEFQKLISNAIKSAGANQHSQKIVKEIAEVKYATFLAEELKIAEERNNTLKNDERNLKQSRLKASLSQMLKSTIEGAIRSK